MKKPSNPKDAVGVLKVPMSTVSAPVLAEIALGMLEGACKYGRHNYRMVGVRSSCYYDAALRHLMAWWEGQDLDPASGLHHVTKAITSLVVLRDAMLHGMCEDDRPPSRDVDFIEAMNKQAAAVIEKHKKVNPRHFTIKDKGRGVKT